MHDINYGGAAKMFSFLSNELSLKDYEINVYTYEGNTPAYNLGSKVIYHYENNIPKSLIIKRVKPFLSVRKKIREINPEIVVSFLPNANVYSIMGTLFTKKKVIITERSDPYTERGFFMDLKRLMYNLADGAVFQTEGAKKYYPITLQKKSAVIPNPVTIEKVARTLSKDRNNEIAFVARFDLRQKRQDLMIKAFQKVLVKHPDIKLAFFGDGQDYEYTKKKVEEIGLTNNILFYGKVTNVLGRIKNNLMFVSTSDYEGISNSLIEAMALGLPVVVTNSSPGGAKMLIDNKVNGILVDRGNINAIANSIINVIESPNLADQLGENAQNIVELYSSDRIIQRWCTYISEVSKK